MQAQPTKPRRQLGVGLAGLAFGIAVAVVGLLRLHDAARSLSWGWLALLTCIMALCGREVGCLLFFRALPRLGLFSPRARIAIVLGAIGAGAFLLVAIPVASLAPRTEHEVTVVATGGKSVQSHGTEVWVHGLFNAQQARVVAPADFVQSGAWELRDEALVSSRQQPAALRWHGSLSDNLQLRFVSHPWSGIAEITVDGIQQTLDLYADRGSTKELRLAAQDLPPSFRRVALLRICETVCLASLLLALTMWLVTRAVPTPVANVGRWAWLAYALPPATVWSYCLWVFWPGLMSPDSLDQWSQMTTGTYSDWHPVFHTWSNWLATRIWLSPAAVAIAQIAAFSAVAGWGLALMRRRGLPRWLAAATCLLMAAMPANGALAITLWKDVPYSIAMLALVLQLLLITTSDGQWLERKFGWLALAVVAALIALYRHNGPPVALATLLILPVIYRKFWRQSVLSLAVSLALFCGIKGPLFWASGVAPAPSFLKATPLLHHIAAHLTHATPLLPEERELLDSIYPLAGAGWPYDAYDPGTLVMSKDCNRTVIAAKLPELARLFGALLVRRPSVNFQHFGVSSELVWKIRWSRCECLPVWSDGKSWYRVDPDERDLPRGKWTFKPIAVTRPLPPLFAWATKDKWAWLTCRSALYMYLFLLGVLVAAVRAAKWQYAVVALPVLVQSSIMALAGMGPCFRYQWSVYLVGMLCSGFLLLGVPLRPAASKGQEGANP